MDDLRLVLIFKTERLVLDGLILALHLGLLGRLLWLLLRSHVCLFILHAVLKFKEFSYLFNL